MRGCHGDRAIARPALTICGLLLTQVALGAAVVLSGRHPEIATAHQATGAALLACTALLAFRLIALRPQPATTAHAA
jgi:heme A synthase